MTQPLRAESLAATRLNWVVLALAVAASAWLLFRERPAPRVEKKAVPSLLRAVPTGPSLLVTVDVEQLGEAAALELLRTGGSALLGLRELCGFEPLLGVRQVAFALPRSEPGKAPDFALIAQTVLEPTPVLRCAEAVIRKRGGTPVQSALGEFRSVRDQKKPLGEVAIRSDGVFVLSGGQYFRDAVDAASGRFVADEEGRRRGHAHAALRRELAPAQLVVTLLDSPGLSVPGVRALGASLRVGEVLELRGYVECYSAPECEGAEALLEDLRTELGSDPGLAPLRQAELDRRGSELRLRARLPREQLGPLLAQLLAP